VRRGGEDDASGLLREQTAVAGVGQAVPEHEQVRPVYEPCVGGGGRERERRADERARKPGSWFHCWIPSTCAQTDRPAAQHSVNATSGPEPGFPFDSRHCATPVSRCLATMSNRPTLPGRVS